MSSTSESFRSYLCDHDHPRLAGIRGLDAYGYRDAARQMRSPAD